MRDRRFVAAHRGGPLTKQQHFDLMDWASRCVEHVMVHVGALTKQSLLVILSVGQKWQNGEASVGDVRKAASKAIALANELEDPDKISAARAVGHAVAVAHMADHSLRAAEYALKVLEAAERIREKQWQNEQLPDSIKMLILNTRGIR